jgi:hypothetical protein
LIARNYLRAWQSRHGGDAHGIASNLVDDEGKKRFEFEYESGRGRGVKLTRADVRRVFCIGIKL